jgi:hypothetical protein
MRSRDWFALGVRLLGVWVLYQAIVLTLHLGAAVLGISPSTITRDFDSAHTRIMYELWYVAGYLAFAFYLLIGAQHLTRALYDDSPLDEKSGGG